MAQETFDICTNCGKETDIIIVDDVNWLCKDCLDELDYFKCDNCNEFWLADVVEYYDLKNGKTLCEHCYDMLLSDGDISEDDIDE